MPALLWCCRSVAARRLFSINKPIRARCLNWYASSANNARVAPRCRRPPAPGLETCNGYHRLDHPGTARTDRPVAGHDLQRPRHVAPALPPVVLRHRRAVEAAPRSGAQSDRDGQGLRGAREGYPGSGRAGTQRRSPPPTGPPRRPRPRASCRPRCASCSRSPKPTRIRRPTRTSSSCSPSSPTWRTRSPPRGAFSTTRGRNTMPRARRFRPCCSPSRWDFGPQEFFNLDEAERKAVQTPPQVKF